MSMCYILRGLSSLAPGWGGILHKSSQAHCDLLSAHTQKKTCFWVVGWAPSPMVVSWTEAGLYTGGLSQNWGGEYPWGASEVARGPWGQKASVGTGDLGSCGFGEMKSNSISLAHWAAVEAPELTQVLSSINNAMSAGRVASTCAT